jgi:hypothetical protein
MVTSHINHRKKIQGWKFQKSIMLSQVARAEVGAVMAKHEQLVNPHESHMAV